MSSVFYFDIFFRNVPVSECVTFGEEDSGNPGKPFRFSVFFLKTLDFPGEPL